MNRTKRPAKYQILKSYQFLANVALLANGFFLLAAPALAQTAPTAPNTVISNQATATYQDPNDPPGTPPINATSNTVTVTVAEVAGILVQAGAVNDQTGDTAVAVANDILEYNFTITNVGNDATRFRIPSAVTVSGKGTVVAGSLEYQNPGSNTWLPVPTTGGITTDSVAVNGVIPVRVRVTVNSDALSGDKIFVTLGETADNKSNVPRVGGEVNETLDVYTVDNPDGAQGEFAGVPANGVVEGSAKAEKTISALKAVLNGPNNQPAAVGPNNNNDDFTNKSSSVPSGQAPGSTFDPGPVTFSNTVQNTSTEPVSISLLPTPPATASDLPSGTNVTITYDGTSKIYVWNGSAFQYQDPVQGLSNINEASDYITIANVAVNSNVNYQVQVNLPSGTNLSTDINRGFPVPITAFVDDATAGLDTETARNTTIDRVYTGFLKLVKYSLIEQGQGPAVGAGQGDFETTPSSTNPGQSVGTLPPVARTPGPGNYIVYQIRYRNISEANVGTGNVILNAANVVITEDGNTATNNWAKDNDGNTVIDTSHVSGSAEDSGASTITFFSGNPSTTPVTNATSGTTINSDVTKYVNTLTDPLAPSLTPRTFTFKRKLN